MLTTQDMKILVKYLGIDQSQILMIMIMILWLRMFMIMITEPMIRAQ